MTQTNISIVIAEGFPLLSLALLTEPLRIANRESSKPIFHWRILSPEPDPPRSSSGRRIDIDGELDESPTDAVILLASYAPARMISGGLRRWLRRRAAGGALMGCVDTGALLFADAGLLKQYPAAAHREAVVGFREAHGDALFVERLFDFHDQRCSSAGGVATFDMTLAIIEHFASSALARRVAEILNYRRLEGDGANVLGPHWSIPRRNRQLALAIEMMLANLEQPLAIEEICQRLDWPVWRLRRLFQRYLGMPPRAYYLELRLEQARNLLRNSAEKVGNIALMCGFPATESLSRAYKARFGVSPGRDRRL